MSAAGAFSERSLVEAYLEKHQPRRFEAAATGDIFCLVTWMRQIGIKAQAETVETPVFIKNRDEYRYSAYLGGWTGETGELANPLRALAATPNRERGMGGVNRGRYSNPALDARLEEAMRTVDLKKRETLLQQASRLLIADYGVLPLYFEVSVWALRRDFAYAARADQLTLAQFVTVRPASR